VIARALAATLAIAVAGATAVAAQEETGDTATRAAAKVAAEFSDPLTTLPQIFLQDAWSPDVRGSDAQINRIIGRVIVPRVPRSSLLPFVQLIRPSFSVVTVPTGRGSQTRTEFGDIQLFDLGVLPWPRRETGLLMGFGPLFVFPTASHRSAGQNAWQAGPAFAAIYKGFPGFLLGALVQNPISFAYTRSDAEPVSTLLFQPVVLAYLGRGFYVKSADSTWTRSWYRNGSTVIPVSFGLGYVMLRDGLPPINAFVSGEWTAYRHDLPVAPEWTARFGLTVAFPEWRPW